MLDSMKSTTYKGTSKQFLCPKKETKEVNIKQVESEIIDDEPEKFDQSQVMV